MGSLTFLTGGARSGKSTLALELARRSGLAVTFIATAPESDASGVVDVEMEARIERHRMERRDQPGEWVTIEEPLDLIGALRRADGTFTIVDCLTLWVSNLMWAGRTDQAIDQLAVDTATTATTHDRSGRRRDERGGHGDPPRQRPRPPVPRCSRTSEPVMGSAG